MGGSIRWEHLVVSAPFLVLQWGRRAPFSPIKRVEEWFRAAIPWIRPSLMLVSQWRSHAW